MKYTDAYIYAYTHAQHAYTYAYTHAQHAYTYAKSYSWEFNKAI